MAKPRKTIRRFSLQAFFFLALALALPLLVIATYYQTNIRSRAAAEGNRAIDFSQSTNGMISTPYFLPQDTFTIEFWMQMKPFTADTRGYTIVEQKSTGTITGMQIYVQGGKTLYEGKAGDLNAYITFANNQVIDMTVPSVATDTWHHVSLMKTATKFRIFLNGALKSEKTYDGSNLVIATPRNMEIGARTSPGYPTPAGQFPGILEELRISSSVRYLSSYTRPNTPFAPDAQTLALYHLDGTANDSSVHARHALSTGTVTYVASGAPIQGLKPQLITPPSLPPEATTGQKISVNWLVKELDGTYASPGDGFGLFFGYRNAGISYYFAAPTYDAATGVWKTTGNLPSTPGTYTFVLKGLCTGIELCNQRYGSEIPLWTQSVSVVAPVATPTPSPSPTPQPPTATPVFTMRVTLPQTTYTIRDTPSFTAAVTNYDGSPAAPAQGFNVQASIDELDASRSIQSITATYNTTAKTWKGTFTPITTMKQYRLRVSAYCAVDGSYCAQTYGTAKQISEEFIITVAKNTTPGTGVCLRMICPNGQKAVLRSGKCSCQPATSTQ